MAFPSRRNSGQKAIPKSFPATFPDSSSNRGIITESVVPGTMVDFAVTTKYSSFFFRALPISRAADSIHTVSISPVSLDGVPTQINATSEFNMASSVSVVPSSIPVLTISFKSSSRPFS